MLAREQNEILGLVKDFTSAIERLVEIEKSGNTQLKNVKAVTTILKFTEKEILKMSKTFKKEFIANGLCAHVIKRVSGKNSFCYEIRYRSNGYNITASSTNLAEAKRKFLEKTLPENIDKYYIGTTAHNLTASISFKNFTSYYFENFRKQKVAEYTFKCDINRLNKHILPSIGNIPIKKITPLDCKKIIDNLMEQEKFKTATEVYNILSCIFKNAIAHNILWKNPLDIISKPVYEQENGSALSKEEEIKLFATETNANYLFSFALGLYCGLRPNELKTATIEGPFIKAKNSKQHSKKLAFKKIPITNKLKPYLANGILPIPNLDMLRKHFNAILPNHKLYDLRTTFYSRGKECGVEIYALSEFMGHSLGKIGNAYTDLSDKYLLKEGIKLDY